MNKQTKISTFFSQQNRSLEGFSEKSEKPPSKKIKLDDTERLDDTNQENKDTQLTAEQRQRMEDNRLRAVNRLHEKQTSIMVGVGESWRTALHSEFTKEYFIKLNTFVEAERKKYTVYPPAEDVFSWTRACTVNDVKVVILGQDPYHGPKQAHGLSFSVQPGVPPPPSLINMYRELETDIPDFTRPSHGCLYGWANQGVLMLNAVLTVRANNANSHKDQGWENFTDATITYLNKNKEGLVFLLWGSYAQKKGAHIDKKKHYILQGVHPSPLSAHRGFFGCKHFSKCNELLKKAGKNTIDWSYLPLK